MTYSRTVISFFALLLVLHLCLGIKLELDYYNEFDALGSLSRYPLYFILLSLVISLVSFLIWQKKDSNIFKILKTDAIYTIFPVILIIFFKYLFPELVDTFYVTNFYDVPDQLRRSFFVANTGYSDANVDGYFDLQPSFFWLTAIILNVLGVSPILNSYLSFIILKWFHLFSILLYIPILYLLYRQLFIATPYIVPIALFLHFCLEFGHFHYAAQSFAIVLYWLILFLSFRYQSKRDPTILSITALCGVSIVFMHQGVTIMTIITFLSLFIYKFFFKIIGKEVKLLQQEMIFLLVIQVTVWVAYLAYLTIFTFRDFLMIFREILATEIGVITKSITRANEVWQQIVIYKAIYILILVNFGIITSLIYGYKKGEDKAKLAFCIQILSAIFFGGISVALGGTGYIERLPSQLLPLIVYSVLNYISDFQKSKKWKTIWAFPLSLIIIMLVGFTFYMSGRNFQSLTYGEYYSNMFIIERRQNIMGLYPDITLVPIHEVITAELSNRSMISINTIIIQRHDLIQTNYYRCKDMGLIEGLIKDMKNKIAIVYTNPDVIVSLKI